jgi:hypothetical protein
VLDTVHGSILTYWLPRSKADSRASISSNSIAFAVWPNTLSAHLALVEAGTFASSMSFKSVETAAPEACWSRVRSYSCCAALSRAVQVTIGFEAPKCPDYNQSMSIRQTRSAITIRRARPEDEVGLGDPVKNPGLLWVSEQAH